MLQGNTKGFAGITASRAHSQPSQGRETALRDRRDGSVTIIGQVRDWKSLLEKGQSDVTEVPLTGGVLEEEGQAKVQRRKCYGFLPLSLLPQNHIITPKNDINA